jgi:NAD(P)-dependent dehydrogenase (short-subunit alcohol dehydrogenase family)
MSQKLFDLSGRVALVTGGSKGLGKAMARGFAEAGADVVISSRHEAELKAAAAEIAEGTQAKVVYFVADMTRRDDVRKLADKALAAMGRVDILVNNAGSNLPQAIDKITDEAWDTIVELNLSSCMALTRALVPQMKERRWGRVIHISSIMGLSSKEERNVYSATKSALLGLARASALDLGAYGITVNCLAPGPFLTDLPGSLLSQEEKDVFARRTALGRWALPRELAGPALLLASDAGSYITGAVLVVDGGSLVKTF